MNLGFRKGDWGDPQNSTWMDGWVEGMDMWYPCGVVSAGSVGTGERSFMTLGRVRLALSTSFAPDTVIRGWGFPGR